MQQIEHKVEPSTLKHKPYQHKWFPGCYCCKNVRDFGAFAEKLGVDFARSAEPSVPRNAHDISSIMEQRA